jgi:multicomponent Na+:H+ antiporter subunit D
VSFDYFDPVTLGVIVFELITGLTLLVLVLRKDTAPSPLVWLRRLHTGNINDYAAFTVVGMIVVTCTILL